MPNTPLIPLHMPLPSTRQIQFLLALKKEGGFHKAAESCGVTQSTISAAIREMETILGATLIDRSNRKKLVFTALGNDMLRTGEEVIAKLGTITERARRSDKLLSTPLRVGIIPTIAPYLLPRILRPLQKLFPELTLHLHELQTDHLLQQLADGTLDYGIMAFPYETPQMQYFPLQNEKFFCAAPKGLFSKKVPLTLDEIEQHKILLLSDGHCLRNHILSACSLDTVNQYSGDMDDVSATSLSTLIQLVAEGYGVTLLPEMVVHHTALPNTMTVLPIANPPTREIGAVWRKKSPIEADAQALSQEIHTLLHSSKNALKGK